MSIADELTKLQTNLKNIYTKLEEKGAKLPTKQNFDNLSATLDGIGVDSIGVGNIKVPAIGTVQTADVGTKVLLVYADEVGNLERKKIFSELCLILPYEYAAVPFNNTNLTESAVTGFIKSQDGTDELGNSIATVDACLDPNATPPSANRLIGMNVTVNEGEPL